MSAKEMINAQVRTDTHYWGYRELDVSELQHVGGGDGYGGWGSLAGGESCSASDYSSPSPEQACSDQNALAIANLLAGLPSRGGNLGRGADAYTNWCNDLSN
jgi:hypothetical protein